MKNKKRLRRFVLPFLLIGLGVFIGTSMAESDQPSIQFHGDFEFDFDEAAGLQELELEISELANELEREISISIPNAPAAPEPPKIIVNNNEETRSPASRVNVGFISVLMGGLGVLAIFVMALMTFSNDPNKS